VGGCCAVGDSGAAGDEDGGVSQDEIRRAILLLAGSVTAASDQADAMTDAQLAARLLSGRWTTIEVHEAARRLMARASAQEPA
jgi:hypothetical protein